jgi:hypothetical protein
VKDAQYRHGIALMKIRDDVRHPRDHQFARTGDSARPSNARVFAQHSDMPNDFKYSFDRRATIVAADKLLDQIKIAVSGARPL